jgi:hypothetical protein
MAFPNSGVSLGDLSGSNAIERLRETIIELDRTTRRQGTIMIWLTVWLVILTIVLVVLTGVLLVAE